MLNDHDLLEMSIQELNQLIFRCRSEIEQKQHALKDKAQSMADFSKSLECELQAFKSRKQLEGGQIEAFRQSVAKTGTRKRDFESKYSRSR